MGLEDIVELWKEVVSTLRNTRLLTKEQTDNIASMYKYNLDAQNPLRNIMLSLMHKTTLEIDIVCTK